MIILTQKRHMTKLNTQQIRDGRGICPRGNMYDNPHRNQLPLKVRIKPRTLASAAAGQRCTASATRATGQQGEQKASIRTGMEAKLPLLGNDGTFI